MAKKALEMKNGVQVRSIEELQENFDIILALQYFQDGSLIAWLDSLYYEEEADALRALDSSSPQLKDELCAILGVATSASAAERLKEKKKYLEGKTNDQYIIANARITALNQEDLSDLLDNDEHTIYLCGETFSVPIRFENKKYIGILGKPKIKIKATSQDELKTKSIIFENVILPWDSIDASTEKTTSYQNFNEAPKGIVVEENDPDELCRIGYEASERGDYDMAFAYLEKSASLNHDVAANTLGCWYADGKGTTINYPKAMYWFKKAAEKNNPAALFNVGLMYENGEGVPTNINEAVKWYDKAVEYGHPGALERLNALSLTGKINRAYNGMGFHYDEHVINAVRQSIGGESAMRSFVQRFEAGDRNAKRTARELGRACNYYLPMGGTPEDNAWDVVNSIKAYLASRNF